MTKSEQNSGEYLVDKALSLLPYTTAFGALAGGVNGMLSEREEDPLTGRRPKREDMVLKRTLIGGGLGALGSLPAAYIDQQQIEEATPDPIPPPPPPEPSLLEKALNLLRPR